MKSYSYDNYIQYNIIQDVYSEPEIKSQVYQHRPISLNNTCLPPYARFAAVGRLVDFVFIRFDPYVFGQKYFF